jgi:hypothetical protein
LRAGASKSVYSHVLAGAARVARRLEHNERAAQHLMQAIEFNDQVGDHPSLDNALDEATFVLWAAGRTEQCLVFVGHAEARPVNSYVTVDDTSRIALIHEQALLELGDAAYEAALQRGAGMRERDLVLLALETLATIQHDAATH